MLAPKTWGDKYHTVRQN